MAHTAGEAADKYNRSEQEVLSVLEECRRRLFAEREKRPRPFLDDKILTAWNGTQS